MTPDIIQIAGSLGVGAFLAVVIALLSFRFIKITVDKVREDRKFMEDRLTQLLEQDQEGRKENTKALTEMTLMLQRLNGRLK